MSTLVLVQEPTFMASPENMCNISILPTLKTAFPLFYPLLTLSSIHLTILKRGNAPLGLYKKKENKIIHLRQHRPYYFDRKRVLPRKLWPKRLVETKYTHSKENNKYSEWHSLFTLILLYAGACRLMHSLISIKYKKCRSFRT